MSHHLFKGCIIVCPFKNKLTVSSFHCAYILKLRFDAHKVKDMYGALIQY